MEFRESTNTHAHTSYARPPLHTVIMVLECSFGDTQAVIVTDTMYNVQVHTCICTNAYDFIT